MERSLTNVRNVAKPLIGVHILLNMREFILERGLTNVENVVKPLIGVLPEHDRIHNRNLKAVINVRNVSGSTASLRIKNAY